MWNLKPAHQHIHCSSATSTNIWITTAFPGTLTNFHPMSCFLFCFFNYLLFLSLYYFDSNRDSSCICFCYLACFSFIEEKISSQFFFWLLCVRNFHPFNFFFGFAFWEFWLILFVLCDKYHQVFSLSSGCRDICLSGF